MTRNSALIFCIALAAAGCGGGGYGSSSPTSPTPAASVPFSQTDIRVGTGAEATAGRNLTVHYTLWLYDANGAQQKGRQLQTSVGGTPFPFTLGTGQVIRGWDQGVPGMRVGGLRRLVIPPELAYGATGAGSGASAVPPNANLVFEVELLAVQ